jgi:hypothetical protein
VTRVDTVQGGGNLPETSCESEGQCEVWGNGDVVVKSPSSVSEGNNLDDGNGRGNDEGNSIDKEIHTHRMGKWNIFVKVSRKSFGKVEMFECDRKSKKGG